MKNGKKNIILFRVFIVLLGIVLIALIHLITKVFIANPYICIALMILLFIIAWYATRIIRNVCIDSVIVKELDAEKYSSILSTSNWLAVSLVSQITAAYYSGDYQTVVNICVEKLNETPNKKVAYYYLTSLSNTYFELDDVSNLSEVCELYEEYISKEKDPSKVRKQHELMEIYCHYIKGEYESCLQIISDAEKRRKGKNVSPLINVLKSFRRAVIYYKNGETERAKELFTYVAETAPKMNYSAIAQKYLLEINGEQTFERQQVLPQSDWENVGEKKFKKFRKIHLIIFIACAVLLTVIYTVWISSYHRGYGLERALSHFYEEYESYEYFVVPHGDGVDEQICIVVHNNQIDMLINKTNPESKMNTIYMEWQDIVEKYSYRVKSAVDEHYLICQLFSNQNDIPNPNLYTAEIKVNGKTKWLCFEFAVD